MLFADCPFAKYTSSLLFHLIFEISGIFISDFLKAVCVAPLSAIESLNLWVE